MSDNRQLVGEDDLDPPTLRSELPDDFQQVLDHRLHVDDEYPGQFWPPDQDPDEDPYYVARNWPGEELIEHAAAFPEESWPKDADLLFRLIAERYRGYAQYVFGDQVGQSFPELENAARFHLEAFRDAGLLEVESSNAAHVAFSRARQWIKWEPFPHRFCPLCDRIIDPNRHFGTTIVQQSYPPRWCFACSGVSHRTPTQRQAIQALQYFVEAAGFIPYSYSEVFRIPPGVQGHEADRVAAGRMAMPFPAMVNSIGLGPWNNYLEAAGLLSGHIATLRGVQSRALDGHWTLSLLERSIDDFMTRHGIEHVHEPHWPRHPSYNPNGRLRADWELPDGTLIEAAGMLASKEYADKISRKRLMATELGIDLVVITPRDLNRLETVFLKWLSPEAN